MTTVRHNNYCHICFTYPIQGSRWRCFCCYDLDLCTECAKRHKQYHPCIEFTEACHKTWNEPGVLSLLSLPSLMDKSVDFFQQPLSNDIGNLVYNVWLGGLPLATSLPDDAMTQLQKVVQAAKEDQWKLLMERENHLHGKYFRLRDIGRKVTVHGDAGTRDLQIYKPAYASMVLVGDDGTPLVAVSIVTKLYTATACRPAPSNNLPSGVDSNSVWIAMFQNDEFVNIVITNLLPAEQNIANFHVKVVTLGNDYVELEEAKPAIDQSTQATNVLPPGYSFVYPNIYRNGYKRIGVGIRPNFLNKRFYNTTWVTPDLITRSVVSMTTSGGNPFNANIVPAKGVFGIRGGPGSNVAPVGGVGNNRNTGWGMSVGNLNPPNNYSGDLKDLVLDLECQPELRTEKLNTLATLKQTRSDSLKKAAMNGQLMSEYRMTKTKNSSTCTCCGGIAPDCILFPCGHRCAHMHDIEARSTDTNKMYIQGCPDCGHMVYSWIGFDSGSNSFINYDESARSGANTGNTAKWRSEKSNILLSSLREDGDFDDIDI